MCKIDKSMYNFIVSDGTANIADVVFVKMLLDLWGALGWVKQPEENS
jgi:hypothetical protein